MSEEFQEKINTIVDSMEKNAEGKWAIPEDTKKDLDEATIHAAMSERRYRDTQSSYTNTRQQLKRQESVSKALQEKILSSNVELTKEQVEELDKLRTDNPEAWREKLNEYESQAKDTLKEELDKISKEAGDKTEVEIRKEQMEAWSKSTGIELNDDIVANELPPRMLKKLEAGETTFQEFLTEAGEFLTKTKVVLDSDDDTRKTDKDEPSLSDAPGGSEPSKKAEEKDFHQSYEETLF